MSPHGVVDFVSFPLDNFPFSTYTLIEAVCINSLFECLGRAGQRE